MERTIWFASRAIARDSPFQPGLPGKNPTLVGFLPGESVIALFAAAKGHKGKIYDFAAVEAEKYDIISD